MVFSVTPFTIDDDGDDGDDGDDDNGDDDDDDDDQLYFSVNSRSK